MDNLLTELNITPHAFAKARVDDGWKFDELTSPFARIYLICDGEQQVTFRGRTFIQVPRKAYLLPPYTTTTSRCDDFCEEYYFIFSCNLPEGEDLFSNYECQYEMDADDLHYQLCEGLAADVPDFALINTDATLYDYNQQILHPDRQLSHHSDNLKIQSVILNLLAGFLINAKPLDRHARFSKSLRYIEKNLQNDLSLAFLSELEGITTTYFSDQFFRQMGIRPSEYIANKRAHKARVLLQLSHLSLDEIAAQVGMNDVSYFCRFFKKRSGYSPMRFRLISRRRAVQ